MLLFLKKDALGIKSLIFKTHLPRQISSENNDPQKIGDGVWLDMLSICAINNRGLFLLSESLNMKILYSFLMSRF